jgi:hypothetical protein
MDGGERERRGEEGRGGTRRDEEEGHGRRRAVKVSWRVG